MATMRRFARIDRLHDPVPDETTIGTLRHLPQAHQLTAQMCDAGKAVLTERKLWLEAGTLVDATTSDAPSSTKNRTPTRDPAMTRATKRDQWDFGMQRHVGTDRRGAIHSLTTTAAATADITPLPQLLHGQETTPHGDTAYFNAAWRRRARRVGAHAARGPRGP
jgi:IS5 family transposase